MRVDDAESLGLLRTQPVGEVVELPRLAASDESGEEPGAAVVAGETHLGERRRQHGAGHGVAEVAGQRHGQPGARRGAGQRGNRRLRHLVQPLADRPLVEPLRWTRASYVVAGPAPVSPPVAMPFTSPPAQNAPPAPVSTTHPTSSATSTSARTLANDSFISLDMALRRSGRFMVSVATPSSITASRSSVPVSRVVIAATVRRRSDP